MQAIGQMAITSARHEKCIHSCDLEEEISMEQILGFCCEGGARVGLQVMMISLWVEMVMRAWFLKFSTLI